VTHVCFRAQVKIAARIVSYRIVERQHKHSITHSRCTHGRRRTSPLAAFCRRLFRLSFCYTASICPVVTTWEYFKRAEKLPDSRHNLFHIILKYCYRYEEELTRKPIAQTIRILYTCTICGSIFGIITATIRRRHVSQYHVLHFLVLQHSRPDTWCVSSSSS